MLQWAQGCATGGVPREMEERAAELLSRASAEALEAAARLERLDDAPPRDPARTRALLLDRATDSARLNLEALAELLALLPPGERPLPRPRHGGGFALARRPAAVRRVLVTGATGFLGAAVVRRLRALRPRVAVTATGRDEAKGAALAALGARFVAADLSAAGGRRTADLCAGHDAVIHCAALCTPWPSLWGPAEAHRAAIVDATRHLVAACKEAGVRRFVHVSTPSLYFAPGDDSIFAAAGAEGVPEWAAPAARQPTQYAAAKLEAEALVRAAGLDAADLCVTILRPRAIIGPGDPTILPRILAALGRRRLPVVGDGHALADFASVENVAHACLLAVDAPIARVAGRTFNITNDEPVLLWAVLRSLCDRLHLPSPRLALPARLVDAAASVVEPLVALAQRAGVVSAAAEPKLTRYACTVLSRSCVLNVDAARSMYATLPTRPPADFDGTG